MKSHLTLGRLLGVPVGVNIWVFAVAAVLALSLAEASLPAIAPGNPTSAYWFAAVIGVLGFLGSLVAHELGHSWVAQRNGVSVVEITLWLFGGVAKLEGDADDPGAEFRIALAGPAMSLVSGLACAALAWGTWAAGGSEVLVALLGWLAGINAVLAVSNLLPAFPLDGGRVLRAVLWRRKGRKRPATRLAAAWGQGLSVALAVAGAVLAIRVSVWSGLWIVALSLFLFVAARAQWADAGADPSVLGRTAGEVVRSLPRPLPANATVADVADALATLPDAPLVPLTDASGAITAMATRDAVGRIPPAHRRAVPATSISEPLVGLPRVSAAETVHGVVSRFGQGSSWWALVIGHDGSMGALLSSDVDVLVEAASA
jgi:Zn-dependent protease